MGWGETFEYWRTIAPVVFVVLLMLVMILEGAVSDFDCPLTQLVTFHCVRRGLW